MNEVEKYTDFLFYNSEDGTTKVQVIADGDSETIWTTQKGMSEIFGIEVNTVNYHLKEVFSSNELDEVSVIRKIRTTASDGKNYLTNYYNLDAIISVGYRVNSAQATRFRIWATQILKEYLIKGFALDDERLKQGGQMFGKDYFSELLERVRAELRVKRSLPIRMAEWIGQINAILQLNGYALLSGKGTRSKEQGETHARKEFDKFRPIQDANYISDFDKLVGRTIKK